MRNEPARFGRRRLVVASLLGFVLAAACGGGETGEPEGVPGSAGTANGAGSSAGSSSSGASGASGAGTAASGGTSGVTAGSSVAGTATSAGASTSGVSGSAGALGGAAGTPGVPEPTDSGLSVYATECRGETVTCESSAVHCLGVFLNEGGVGYTCSNLCRTDDDCSDAPSGAEAYAGCVAFTNASRCVLVCHDNAAEYSCPPGMGCYRYPNFPVGYCLWL